MITYENTVVINNSELFTIMLFCYAHNIATLDRRLIPMTHTHYDIINSSETVGCQTVDTLDVFALYHCRRLCVALRHNSVRGSLHPISGDARIPVWRLLRVIYCV